MVNTVNLNLLVTDTPIWYDPGTGPKIAFTLTYSNENSNTGIFGRSWRCQYDMRVFFLPSDYQDHPTLQVHKDTGRIETYEWNGTEYVARAGMQNYGYRHTISKMADGTVVISLKGGGKYYFKPEGDAAEGRIWKIEDNTGKYVECQYDDGKLARVVDANGRVTTITTTGSGVTERVTRITLPQPEDGRHADFEYYDDLSLKSITDMAGFKSTFSYDALLKSDWVLQAKLNQDMTTSEPADGGSISIASLYGSTDKYTEMFPSSGIVEVSDGVNTEQISYAYKTVNQLKSITRGTIRHNFSSGAIVRLVQGSTATPYLHTIETPSGKTKFEYEWWTFSGEERPVAALHEVYECGPAEDYPSLPTMHIAWCSFENPYKTRITNYPSSVNSGVQGCDDSSAHWTGGQTTTYVMCMGSSDAIMSVIDPTGKIVLTNIYENRKIIEVITPDIDGDGLWNTTGYTYENGKLKSKTDPLGNTWTYAYENNRLKGITDPYNRLVASYTYDAAGHVVQMDSPFGTQAITHYDANGKLDYTIDGRGKKTIYRYNENGETRGFLTSVEDPEGKTTRFHYDSKGRMDSITDAEQNTVTYQYDDLDRITKVTNPDNTFVETYYSCCHPEWIKDENGKITAFEYDSKNRLWLTIAEKTERTLGQDVTANPLVPGNGGSLTLDNTEGLPTWGALLLKNPITGVSEIISYTGISGQTLTGISRGALGTSPIAVGQCAPISLGVMTRVVYDPGEPNRQAYQHRVVGTYDARGKYTSYEYYDNDLLKKVTMPDGAWEEIEYDDLGNVKKITKGLGTEIKVIEYQYDANGRVIKVTGAS